MVVSAPENCEVGPERRPIALLDLHTIEHSIALKSAEAFGELTGGPIALAFVLAADILGVKLNIDRALLRRVTMVRIPVKAKA
jgi:hypothetical protein